MINHFYKSLFVATLALVMLPSMTMAAVLAVTFEETPLFLNANVVPGDSESRTVLVTNTGTDSQAVYASVQNTFSDGLAEIMQLAVTDGSATYYDGTFSNFFTTSPIALGTLAGGASRTYTFSASIDTGVGNEYQNTTFGFDLIIGFEGGESVTDGSSGGSSGGSGSQFTIFNEDVASVDNNTKAAVLTWNTNRRGSTYIVCGNTLDGPLNLDPSAPFFGYSFDVPEVNSNNVSHTITLTNLAYGTYECRPASRPTLSTDFTVGDTLGFTLTSTGMVLGESISNPDAFPTISYNGAPSESRGPDGLVLGASDDVIGSSSSTTIAGTETGITRSLPIPLTLKNDCVLLWLILLIIISFSWSIIEDLLRATRSYFNILFFRNTIFSIAYLIAIYLGYTYDLLGQYWWVLAGAWAVMVTVDYRAHQLEFPNWSAVPRNLFYSATGLLFLLTSYFFALPCIWWPFAVIAAVSLALFVFEKYGQTTITPKHKKMSGPFSN